MGGEKNGDNDYRQLVGAFILPPPPPALITMSRKVSILKRLSSIYGVSMYVDTESE